MGSSRKEEDLKLISLVKERPILYDQTHKDYYNKMIRFKVWLEIAKILGDRSKANKLRLRWTRLKSTFTRNLQYTYRHRQHIWWYTKSLLFLTPHIKTQFTCPIYYVEVVMEEDPQFTECHDGDKMEYWDSIHFLAGSSIPAVE